MSNLYTQCRSAIHFLEQKRLQMMPAVHESKLERQNALFVTREFLAKLRALRRRIDSLRLSILDGSAARLGEQEVENRRREIDYLQAALEINRGGERAMREAIARTRQDHHRLRAKLRKVVRRKTSLEQWEKRKKIERLREETLRHITELDEIANYQRHQRGLQ